MTPKELKKMDKESEKLFREYIEPYVQKRLQEQAKEIFEELGSLARISSSEECFEEVKRKYLHDSVTLGKKKNGNK